jgi:hypothetical protein
MYDTDKYKNYMSMIPQAWLGKARALGWLGGQNSGWGQLGNTDPRPTPDWLPRNFQSPNRTPEISNGEMADWFRGRLLRKSMFDPTFENYGTDRDTGEKYSLKSKPPVKFQSIGSDEKGNTKYEIRPYSDTIDWVQDSVVPEWWSSKDTHTKDNFIQGVRQGAQPTVGLPGGINWNYNPFQIYDRKTNRVDVQPWMEDRTQFATNFGYSNNEQPYTGIMSEDLEKMWKKLQKKNYLKAAELYNNVGAPQLDSTGYQITLPF